MNVNEQKKMIDEIINCFKNKKIDKIINSYNFMKNDLKKNEEFWNYFFKLIRNLKIKDNLLLDLLNIDDLNIIFTNELIEPKTKINFFKSFYYIKKWEIAYYLKDGFINYNKKSLVEYGKKIINYINNILLLSKKLELYQNNLVILNNFFKIYYLFYEVSYIFIESKELTLEISKNLKTFFIVVFKPLYEKIPNKYKNIKFYSNFLKIKITIVKFILHISYLCLNNYTLETKDFYFSILDNTLEVAKNIIEIDILLRIKEILNNKDHIDKPNTKIINDIIFRNDNIDILKKINFNKNISTKYELEVTYTKFLGKIYFYLNLMKDDIDYLPSLNSYIFIKKYFISNKINKDYNINYIYKLNYKNIKINIKNLYKSNKNYLLNKFNLTELEPIWNYFKDFNNIHPSIISKVNKNLFDKNLLEIIKNYNNFINPIDFSYSIRKFMEKYFATIIILKDHSDTFYDHIFKDLFSFDININKNQVKYIEEEKIIMKMVAVTNYIKGFESIISTHYLSLNSNNLIKDLIENYFLPFMKADELYNEDEDDLTIYDEVLHYSMPEIPVYEKINEKLYNKRYLYYKNDTKKLVRIEMKLVFLQFLRNINYYKINNSVDIFELFRFKYIESTINFLHLVEGDINKYHNNENILEIIYFIIHNFKQKLVLEECIDLFFKFTSVHKNIYYYENYHLSCGIVIFDFFYEESHKYKNYINKIIDIFKEFFKYEDNTDNYDKKYLKKISAFLLNKSNSFYWENKFKYNFKNNLKEIMIRDNIYLDFKLFLSYRVFVTNENWLYNFMKFLFIYEAREIINGNDIFNFSLFYFLKSMKKFYFERKKVKKHELKENFWKEKNKNIFIIKNLFDLFNLFLKGDKFSEKNKKNKLNEDILKLLSYLLKLINSIFEANSEYIGLFFSKYLKSKINDINYLMKSEIKKNNETSNLFIMHYFNLIMTLLDNDNKKMKLFIIKFMDINEIYFSICKLVLKFFQVYESYLNSGIINNIEKIKKINDIRRATNNFKQDKEMNFIEKKNYLIIKSKEQYFKTIKAICFDENFFLSNNLVYYKNLKNAYINRKRLEENEEVDFYEILDYSINIFSKLSNLKSDYDNFNLFFIILKKSFYIYKDKREKTNINNLDLNKIFYLSVPQQLEIYEFLNKITASVRISNENNEEIKIYFLKVPKSLFLKKKVKEEYINIYDYSNIECKNIDLMKYFDYFLKYCELDFSLNYETKYKFIILKIFKNSNKIYKGVQIILWLWGFLMNIISLFTFSIQNSNIFTNNISLNNVLNITNYTILILSSIFLINWFIFRYLYSLELERKKYEINNLSNKGIKRIIDIYLFNTIIYNHTPLLYIFHIILCILFLLDFKSFYSMHLFSIIFLSQTIKFITSSLTKQISQFLNAILLAALIIYSFSNLLIQYFRESINTRSEINYCNSLLSCFINSLNYGFRNPEGLGGLMTELPFNSTIYFTKFFFEIIYFILINIFFLNVIQSIIVDQFNSAREEKMSRNLDQKNFCMICGIERKYYVKKSKNFDYHIETRHNFLNYFHYYAFLNHKKNKFNYYNNSTDKNINLKKELYFFNSTEDYVYNCIKHKITEWFPKFELNEEEDNTSKKINDILLKLKELNN